MYELCDRRAESAEQFRAVNTVVNEKGVLVGHNTDGIGWSRALREAFGRGPGELRIVVLGQVPLPFAMVAKTEAGDPGTTVRPPGSTEATKP